MGKRIAVIDYHKGNLQSVARGLAAAGGEAFISDDAAALSGADALVLPGVGAFADAAASMDMLGQREVVRAHIAAGKPFLGICLGMHLMFEEGVEGAPDEDDEMSSHNARGLAVLPGVVGAMPRMSEEGNACKVPHVGWNSIEFSGNSQDCPLLVGIKSGEYFYFTHGYLAPDTPCTIATTTHSVVFPSVVQYGDVAFGVQFHPEKSSDAGSVMLHNFVTMVKGA